MGGLGGRGPQNVNPARSTLENNGRGIDNPTRTTNQKDQLQVEQKKHQEIAQRAISEKQQQGSGSVSNAGTSTITNGQSVKSQQKKPEGGETVDKIRNLSKQTTQEMTRSAAEAASKRAKKAQDASVSKQ